MSSTWSSKDGFQPTNSVTSAVSDLIRFPSWKELSIVDVAMEDGEAAFEWLIEQHGHNEFNTSYGPTFDSEWFGPFTSYARKENYCFVIRDRHHATLFKLFNA